jgi:hypothetical protein
MRPLDNPAAPPERISDREFERYAGQGYPTSERDGMRIVDVPAPIYEARALANAKAKRRARERNRRRERSRQRRLGGGGR